MKRRNQSEKGQSLVETTLMLVVIFMVTFGIIELCGMIYAYATIANAAEEGARYGITTSGISADDSRIVGRVKSFASASLHDVKAISVHVSLPDGNPTPPNRVSATVSYSYVPWLSVVSKPGLTMTAYSEARMVVE